MEIKKGFCTGVGSVPHKDTGYIVDFILENFGGCPFWPQIPAAGFNENMYVQYSEGLPAVVIDRQNEKIFIDFENPSFDEMLTAYYENFLSKNTDYWKISEQYAVGLYSLHAKINSAPYIKGQVIGPVTYGLKLTDKNGRSVFYDPQYKDVIIKNTLMKAKWMAGEFRKKTKAQPVIFIDEPYLSSFGSAFIAVSREDVIEALRETIDELRQDGIITGIHCCGNTDWGLVIDTGVDIINLDAYNFADGLLLYPEKLSGFINRGGKIAWGIVPTSDQVEGLTPDDLTLKLKGIFNLLAEKGIDRKNLEEGVIITPACGLGSLSEKTAEKIIRYARAVSDSLNLK